MNAKVTENFIAKAKQSLLLMQLQKLLAYWCTVNYREGCGMHTTHGISFNHESPRRGETLVTCKITRVVAEIASRLKKNLFLGNLEAADDWDYAKEDVESMWLMLPQDKPYRL